MTVIFFHPLMGKQAKAKASTRPANLPRVPVWRRSTVIVATVGAVGVIVAAGIGVFGNWLTKTSGSSQSKVEYLNIVDRRIDVAKKAIADSASGKATATSPSTPASPAMPPSSHPAARSEAANRSQPSSSPTVEQMLAIINEIIELQRQHGEAVKNGHWGEAHELVNEINKKMKDAGLDDRYEAALPLDLDLPAGCRRDSTGQILCGA